MANRYSLNQVGKISNRKVFFDANVLIYIFWPSGKSTFERIYSKVFAQLLRKKNQLFVDFLVLSEIINRAHRIEYEKYIKRNNLNKKYFYYKKYRDSEDGKSALSDIYLIVQCNILSIFSVTGKSFDKNDIKSFLIIEKLDFVDKAILNICLDNNYVLCTNDIDYENSNIDIITNRF